MTKDELRKHFGLGPEPEPHVPISLSIVDEAYKRAKREAMIATGVGGIGAVLAAVILLATPVNGVVVAMGTMLTGQLVGLGWLKMRLRRKRK